MPIILNTKSVYYKTPHSYIPIGVSPTGGEYASKTFDITGANNNSFVGIAATNQGSPTEYKPIEFMRTFTVTVKNTHTEIINGIGITVYENSYVGQLKIYFEAIQTDSKPIVFSLPEGFPYLIVVKDPDNLCITEPKELSGIVARKDENFILYCQVDTDIRSAKDIKIALNQGVDLTDLVGEQIECPWRDKTLVWDVVDYGYDNVTLMSHYILPTLLPFDTPEATYCIPQSEPITNMRFNFGIEGGTQYTFSVGELSLQSPYQLRFNTSRYEVYADSQSTEPLQTGTVYRGTATSGVIRNLGWYQDPGMNDEGRTNYGSNNFGESGIFQWLNSDADEETILEPKTPYGRPYVKSAGFLNGLDPEFLDTLDVTVWNCSTNMVYEADGSAGEAYQVVGYVGLASLKEIYGEDYGVDDRSNQFQLFVDATNTDRIKTILGTDTAQGWWLRTPYRAGATGNYRVPTTGYDAGTVNTNEAMGVVPVVKIRSDSMPK